MGERSYFCIDMKTFYASVECADRGLNPFETNLVVADLSRGKNALCLAVSPRMKAQGVKNRCRLSDIPACIRYEVAPPRMQRYVDCAADIYALYLRYFSPADIHVYSIDESFIDATPYLGVYKKTPGQLARELMGKIAGELRIPSTAGIGTNLYLAKVALDITAKHSPSHIGVLDEESYRATLWDHEPITDFWQVGAGTARTLQRYGIRSMRGVAEAPEELLYRRFGVNAELLIDHAWGRESCRIEDIKNYRPQSQSVSFSQILPRDYTKAEAATVITEMLFHGTRELMRRHVIARGVSLYVGYSRDLRPADHGGVRLIGATATPSKMLPFVQQLFDTLADPVVPVRRLGLNFTEVSDEDGEGYDLFSDPRELERERSRERTALALTDKYGKNAVLRGVNYLPAATQRERNGMIGGHRAGYDDTLGAG